MKKLMVLCVMLVLFPMFANGATPTDNFQARALDHLRNARIWAGNSGISITEINAESNSDERWNKLLEKMQEQASEDNVELFGWAANVWSGDYEAGIYARDNGNWITQETGALWENKNVSLSALEIGDGYSGDISWAYLQEEDFAFLESKGIQKLRLPIRWERMSDGFYQGLNSEMKNEVVKYINWAGQHNMTVLIDIHNYGEYKYDGGSYTVDEKKAEFIDFLFKMGDEFQWRNGFAGIEIMNEPANSTDWLSTSNDIVNALRDGGRQMPLYVSIPGWAGVHSIDELAPNGPWLDNETNTSYVAHYYPNAIGMWGQYDGTFTGTYDQELASAASYGIEATEDETEEETESSDSDCVATADTATNGGWGWNPVLQIGCLVGEVTEEPVEEEPVEEVIECPVCDCSDENTRIQNLEGLLRNIVNLINAVLN